ncbi:MAG: glycosyltransferase family 39 protein [Anaerolineales bacterium]|nr:glycosyltransferase family 39 protein [Anaerolineales bacterium]
MLLILFLYLALGLQYARLTPAWQVPDEPAHYNVIRQIAQAGRLPRLEAGDYDQAYLERLTGARFPPDLPIDRVQYQDYQPPLYYLLAAPVFLLSGGSLAALRLFSLALGAGVIVFTYLAVRAVTGSPAPGAHGERETSALPSLAAGFTAFIPQHMAMLAGVNNDALAELLIALGLWLALRGLRAGRLNPWAAGLVLGLAFLTKVQAYLLAPVLVLAVGLNAWRGGRAAWRAGLRTAVILLGVGLALGALYWGRNWIVCGPWDLVCGRWHNQIVVGQPTTAEWITRYGWWGTDASLLNRFLVFTFQSFWGQFGWMAVVMDRRVYLALLAFTAALAVGALGAARGWRAWPAAGRTGLLVLGASALLSLAVYLYYNMEFVQHQGRYLFPALVPLSLAAAAGLRQWGRWLRALVERFSPSGPLPGLTEAAVPALALAGLAGLCWLALYRFILPALA